MVLKKIGEPTNYHGGFGFVARTKAEGLANSKISVHVFVPRYAFDGINTKTLNMVYNKVNLHFIRTKSNPFVNRTLYTKINDLCSLLPYDKYVLEEFKKYDIDLFHSEDPFNFSIIASQLGKPHIKILQDPFDRIDKYVMKIAYMAYMDQDPNNFVTEVDIRKLYFKKSGKYYTKRSRLSFSDLILNRYLSKEPKETIFTAARFISEKAREMFNLNYLPKTFYNPVDIPRYSLIKKSNQPTILFLGRFEDQKRIDVALKIAKNMQKYDFYFVGAPSPRLEYNIIEKKLKLKYHKYKNIHFTGFIGEAKKERYCQKVGFY